MEKIYNNSIVAMIAIFFSQLIGGWDKIMQTLVLFITIDYITGLIKAMKNKQISSQIGFFGILKKSAIFIVIIIANHLDNISNLNEPLFRTMCIYFYIGNEGISIMENLKSMGVVLPNFIVSRLEEFKNN